MLGLSQQLELPSLRAARREGAEAGIVSGTAELGNAQLNQRTLVKQAFFDVLRRNAGLKPVVILKGGRTQKGQAAAASHTGSLAGDDRVWVALSRQTGCVLVDTLDEFLDALLAFQALTLRDGKATKQVALFGNGGGTGPP